MAKKFRVTTLRELNFRFRGHPRKFITVHRENLAFTKTSTEELCVFVAIMFIVKSGRQLLDKH